MYISIQNATSSLSEGSPTISALSILLGVFVSFSSAILIYIVRQYWERKKLYRALLTEVEEMDGLELCANQMGRIDPPPNRKLKPSDVPTEDSIPTTVYENTASKIGLLAGIRRNELKGTVQFYSKILRYKSIIQKINHQESSDSSVSNNDQEDLYNKIGHLNTVRERIIDSESFDVDYPDELS